MPNRCNDLAREGDTEAHADDYDGDLDEELNGRQLPISMRTRMAFTRFVTRYTAATRDQAFELRSERPRGRVDPSCPV